MARRGRQGRAAAAGTDEVVEVFLGGADQGASIASDPLLDPQTAPLPARQATDTGDTTSTEARHLTIRGGIAQTAIGGPDARAYQQVQSTHRSRVRPQWT